MYFRIEYTNGYCGCDVNDYIEAENIFEAEKYAANCLENYISDYAYFCIDESIYEEEYEEAYEEYRDGCTYDIFEITKEEYEENSV